MTVAGSTCTRAGFLRRRMIFLVFFKGWRAESPPSMWETGFSVSARALLGELVVSIVAVDVNGKASR